MTFDPQQLSYREGTEADRYCAVENWLSSYRSSFSAGLICFRDWHTTMRPQIQRILSAAGVWLAVAYNPEMEPESKSDIYGWLAVRRAPTVAVQQTYTAGFRRLVFHDGRPLVLYCYVKLHFRGFGVARGLFEHVGINPEEDRFDYIARTDAFMEHPRDTVRYPRGSLFGRMPRARWTPLAVRRDDYERREEDERPEPRPA